MRKIRTRIEFEFDPQEMLGSEDQEITMSEEEQLQHAAVCFTEDIEQMVKYNELYKVALERTTFIEVE